MKPRAKSVKKSNRRAIQYMKRRGSTELNYTKPNCKMKQRFPDKLEADLAAIMYNNDRVIVFTPVESYKCIKHNCWHIGHKYSEKWRN